jgi:O-antigen ligase
MASPGLRERIRTTGPQTDNVKERLALYQVACWEFQDRPIIGFGPGQGIAQKQYAERLPEPMRGVMRHPHIHSFHLNFLADFGIAGYLLFLSIIGIALVRLWQTASSSAIFIRAIAMGVFWGLIGVLIGDFFDTLMVGPSTAMEMFWFLGLLFGIKNENN